ncbi:MAG: hypothetical protein ABSF69_18715 [Polyangiaceae bacterium]
MGDFSEKRAAQSAGECSHGADSDDRTKRVGLPAPDIEEAIRALVAGDVETARRLLQ